jgi:hypothetical protein
MATCSFNGFEGVRGTIAKRTTLVDGKRETTRVIAQVRNGKQRIYIREEKQRCKPISDNEIKARSAFTAAAKYFNSLTPEQIADYLHQFDKDHQRIGAKKYTSLRGYVMARFYKGDLIPFEVGLE